MSNYQAFFGCDGYVYVEDMELSSDIDFSNYIGTTDTPWKKMITPSLRETYRGVEAITDLNLYFCTYPGNVVLLLGREDYMPPGIISMSMPARSMFLCYLSERILARCNKLPMPGNLLVNQNLLIQDYGYNSSRFIDNRLVIGWDPKESAGGRVSFHTDRMRRRDACDVSFSQDADFTGVTGIRCANADGISLNGEELQEEDGVYKVSDAGVCTISVMLGREFLGDLEIIYD